VGIAAVRVRIYGRVQGVWFRGWAADQARRMGVSGWVRNRSDGSVEALFSGPDVVVREMIARCRRGPELARVDRLEEIPEVDSVPAGFEQLPTC